MVRRVLVLAAATAWCTGAMTLGTPERAYADPICAFVGVTVPNESETVGSCYLQTSFETERTDDRFTVGPVTVEVVVIA